jgi:hypothetical protein
MEMMEDGNGNPVEPSRYMDRGAPKHCFLPSCRRLFEAACVHGEDGHYYCSQQCTDTARAPGAAGVKGLSRRFA